MDEQRTQSSIAISEDKKRWILINASPDIRAQLLAAPHLEPHSGLRDSAVDAYLNFVRHSPWQEAAASSLTELLAPVIHGERLNTWPDKYPWIEHKACSIFVID